MGNRKLPFGYQMRFGDVIPYPDEAEAVQKTYQNYLAGASFRQIAEGLQAQGIPYDGDKQWNKNMVVKFALAVFKNGTNKSDSSGVVQ